MTLTLERFRGRICDLDSHEQMPIARYPEYFGEIGRRMVDENREFWDFFGRTSGNHTMVHEDVMDVTEIAPESVWETKGVFAPGATDMARRTKVMDVMGIRRQLVFPGFGHVAFTRAAGAGQAGLPPTSREQEALAREAVDAHNRWAGRYTRMYPDRIKIVGMIESGAPNLTPESLTKKAEELIDIGVGAIQIFAGQPPAGLSPANTGLDSF